MDEVAKKNVTLMQQILQLEQERDQLRHDVEQLCKQQSGFLGTSDIIARMQGRRISGLEQELEGCKQKVAVSTRENRKLQEELTEVYHIKSQFAELLRVESEKSTQLEKDVKFFQSRVAVSLAERDRVILEAEKLQSEEEDLLEKTQQLQDSLIQANAEVSDKTKEILFLEEELSKLKSELGTYEQLAAKFWLIRDSVERCSVAETAQDKATTLLQDPEERWRYVNLQNMLQDSHWKSQQVENNTTLIEEQLKASLSSLSDLQSRLGEECYARSQAEEKALHYKRRLSRFAEIVGAKLQKIKASKNAYFEDVAAILNEERGFISLISERWLEILSHDKQSANTSFGQSEERNLDAEEAYRPIQMECDNLTPKQDGSCSKASNEDESSDGGCQRLNECREALAQALQQKVAALLLLSQQEERHMLESNVTAALESQIRQLKEQLSKVTREKVSALMEASRLQEKCRQLQDEQREPYHMMENAYGTSANSRLLPAGWSSSTLKGYQSTLSHQKENKKAISTGYFKHWLRGFELPGSKPGTSSVFTTKEEDALSTARLRVETVALQESLSGLQHLTGSITHLRLKMVKAYFGGTEKAPSGSMEIFDSVIGEAQHLKVALGGSLPLSYSSCSSNDSIANMEGENVVEDLKDEEKDRDAPNIVSFCGKEMVSLLLLAAELNKELVSEKVGMMTSH